MFLSRFSPIDEPAIEGSASYEKQSCFLENQQAIDMKMGGMF